MIRATIQSGDAHGGATGVILVAQRQQLEDLARLDIDLRDGIVLLQRH